MSPLSLILSIGCMTWFCEPGIAFEQQTVHDSSYSVAQKKSLPSAKLRSQSLELGLFDPMGYPLGLQYSLMLTKQSSVVLGLGLFSIGSGFRYYLNDPRENKLVISAGIQGGWLWEAQDIYYDEISSNPKYGYAVYAPIGIHYWGKKGFTASLTAGPLWLDNPPYLSYIEGQIPVALTLNVGHRFGYDIAEAKGPEPCKFKSMVSGRIGLVNPFAALTYEYLFTPWLSGELVVGLFGIAGGVNVYYPALREGRVSMKAGMQTGLYGIFWESEQSFFSPIGVTYLSKNRWLVGVDIGPQYFAAFDLYYGISGRIGIKL